MPPNRLFLAHFQVSPTATRSTEREREEMWKMMDRNRAKREGALKSGTKVAIGNLLACENVAEETQQWQTRDFLVAQVIIEELLHSLLA